MLKVAEKLAEQLLALSGVAQVGLFGSVARAEENPSDVDLFVLTEEEDIPLSILEKAEKHCTLLYPLGCAEVLNILGDPDSAWKVLFKTMWGVDVNIIVMPAEPTNDFLDRFSWVNSDEAFLENTARDFQLFNPESGHFQKAEAPWADCVAQYTDEGGLRIVEGYFNDDYKAGFDAGYNVVVIPHEWPDETWAHLYCLNEEVAEQVVALVPRSSLVNPTEEGNPVVYVGEVPEALSPEVSLRSLESVDEEDEWYDDDYSDYDHYDHYDYELKATCPECHEAVGWWDEACENCGAQLLPIPLGGFGQDKRPHWGPRQVRTSSGVKPGNMLVKVTGRPQGRSTITVLTEPRPDDVGQRFEYLTSSGHQIGAYLADFGILPYDAGSWNRTNHLLRTGRRRIDISTLNISD